MLKNLIIAEIGSVHDGSFGNALKLIDLAAKCGANSVKFQTHIASAETVVNAPSPSYFNSESRYEYFIRTSFSKAQWIELKAYAEDLNLLFLSSPFSLEAIELLEDIDIKAYKIPSGEITNHPLLEEVAKLKKPVLLSSGMSNWSELDEAVSIIQGACPLVVMQCSSQYPCRASNVGINIISEIRKRYSVQVGFSDHTLGYAAPISAAAHGATVIEKHLTFSRGMYGSDAPHSMEPQEFILMAKEIRDAWVILENPVNKSSNEQYQEMKNVFEKIILAKKEIMAGETLEFNKLSFKKAGLGTSASRWSSLVGLKAKRNIATDEKIMGEDFE